MALSVSHIKTAASTTSGSSFAVTSVSATEGNMLVIALAIDNDTNNEIPTAYIGGTQIDVTLVSSNTRGTGSADGVTLAIYTALLTKSISSETITFYFTGSIRSKTVNIYEVSSASNKSPKFKAAYTAAGTSTAHSTAGFSVTNGMAIIGSVGLESNIVGTGDSDTTYGSWSAGNANTANTGTDTTSIRLISQYKVATGTGTQSYDTSTTSSKDYVISAVVIEEVDPYFLVKSFATAGAYSSETSVSVTGINAEIGDMIVATCVADNNGYSSYVSSVTDSGGNSYTSRASIVKSAGSVRDGVAVDVRTSLLTTALTGGDVTVNFSAGVTAKIAGLFLLQPSRRNSLTASFDEYNGSGLNNWAQSTSSINPGSGCVVIGVVGIENNAIDDFAGDSDSDGGVNWSSVTSANCDGAAGLWYHHQHKVITSSASIAYNTTTTNNNDYAIVIVSIEPVFFTTLTATKVTSTNTFGSPTVIRNLAPTKVTSTNSFGSHALVITTILTATAVTDGDSVGAHALQSVYDCTASILTNTNSFGSPSVEAIYDLTATLESDADSIGSHVADPYVNLSHTRHAQVNSFGSHVVSPTYDLTTAAVSDSDSFGSPTAESVTILSPGLFSDGDTLGGDTILPEYNTTASLVTDDDIFLSPTALAVYTLTAALFASTNSFGANTVTTSYTSTASHVSDSDSFGTHTLVPGPVTLTATPLVLTNSFGAHTVVPGEITLTTSALSDDDSFGSHTVLPGAVTLTATHDIDPDWHGTHTIIGIYTATASVLSDGDTFGTHIIVRMSKAVPYADATDGQWTNQAGSQVDLYASIDEASYDDADYIQSVPLALGESDIVEIRLSALGDAGFSTNHFMKYRFDKEGDQVISLTVYLVQGTTVIKSWTHNNVSDAFIEGDYELTAEEADSITDYSDLRLRLEAAA